MEERSRRAADILDAARGGGDKPLRLPDSCRPLHIQDAYAVQRRVSRNLGPTAGWKVGRLRPSGELIYAPLHGPEVHHSPAEVSFAARDDLFAEIEIGLEICKSEGRPADEDVLQGQGWIARLVPAVEIISSRYRDIFQAPALDNLADGNGCGSVIVGNGGKLGRSGDKAGRVSLRVDGEMRADMDYRDQIEPARDLFRSLVVALEESGNRLEPGMVVITGSMIFPVPAGRHVVADFGSFGRVSAELRRAG